MGFDFFLNQPRPETKTPQYDLVGGSFGCSSCGHVSDEAQYYPAQKLLTWDCDNCKNANNLNGFSLD